MAFFICAVRNRFRIAEKRVLEWGYRKMCVQRAGGGNFVAQAEILQRKPVQDFLQAVTGKAAA